MAKPSLMDYAKEEEGLTTTVKMTEAAPVAVDIKKNTAGRGRPKTKPQSKLTCFHLPLDLIAKIDAEAVQISGGNKSGLLIKILEEYFAKKG